MKNIYPKLIFAGAILAVFAIGRFTAPQRLPNSSQVTDSLLHDLSIAVKELSVAKDSIKFYKQAADLPQKVKIIYRKIYVQDTSRNRALTLTQRDSAFRAIFVH